MVASRVHVPPTTATAVTQLVPLSRLVKQSISSGWGVAHR